MSGAFPLFDRFPRLAAISRIELCDLPSPVHRVEHHSIAGDLWIKRDDLNSTTLGGNKARSLEFLLGGVQPGDTVVAVGGAGSTHILATARHAESIGAKTIALRWTHDMNRVAHAVSSSIEEMMPGTRVRRSTLIALAVARYKSFSSSARYIPIGGSSPLGILGHVNAALELVEQIRAKILPMPEKIVLPLGSGGTTAGLLLGFAIAGLPIQIVGARVGPRAVVHRRRVLGLTKKTATLIEKITGEKLPKVDEQNLKIVHDFYGGAYGRPLDGAEEAGIILREAARIRLDDTYSAKAWVAALRESKSTRGPVLFWLTFDARCLTN